MPAGKGAFSETFISALLGAAAGSLFALLTAGQLEREKLSEREKFGAILAYIDEAWEKGEKDKNDAYKYQVALSKLGLFAPPSALRAIEEYSKTCNGKTDPYECRVLWTKVMVELRRAASGDRIGTKTLHEATWGEDYVGQ
ncbi:MAG: hypothetical protein AAGF10_04390 [Verrucomicrobiota bacterium]